MRVLVYPHLMEIGGSQLNAIELAEQVQAAGHEVVVFAPEGELNVVALERGLEVVRSPSNWRWPTAGALRRLVGLVRERSIDLVHGYEWGPCVELVLGPYGLLGTPMITTVMSMDVPDLIPLRPPLIVGTAELAAEQEGVRRTLLAEPWIDTAANAPGVSDTRATRARLGLGDDDLVLAVICRMTTDLEKSVGVLAAMQGVHDLALQRPARRIRLLLVGDGDQLDLIRHAAAEFNALAGFDQVVVAGAMIDPRGAYDCADVVLGMGSSALKGLSFAKPLVVQGPGGFWRAFSRRSVEVFDHQGFFGHGTAPTAQQSADVLRAELGQVLDLDPAEQQSLGEFGRRYIETGYSIAAATGAHLDLYADVVSRPPTPADRAATVGRTLLELSKFKVALARNTRRAQRAAAEVAADLPHAGQGTTLLSSEGLP